MPITLGNIRFGEGDLFVKGAGEVVFTDVGATMGAQLSVKKKFKLIEAGSVMAPIGASIIGEEGTFKVRLKETSLRNLALALGLNPADCTTKITFGNEKDIYYIDALYYYVPSLVNPTFKFTSYHSFIESGLNIDFSKQDEVAFDVVFRLLASLEASAPSLGTVGQIDIY